MRKKAESNPYEVWRNDWCLFAKEVLKVNLDKEQQMILSAVQNNPRVSVMAGTARGKDFVGAVAALCFMYLTPKFDGTGRLTGNTKVALTGPTSRQVVNIMYPEVVRLFQNAKILPGRLVGTDIRTDWEEWFLTGFKADDTNQEAWSGFHAVNTMFIITEATGVSELTFQAIEGNLQGNSRILCISNPNTSIGYAARTMTSSRWKAFRLDDLNAPNVVQKKIVIPGQVDYEWVKDKVSLWCEQINRSAFDAGKGDFEWKGDDGHRHIYRPNDLFRVKVRGMFPEVSEDVLIPPLWIEMAQQRWLDMRDKGLVKSDLRRIGVDVAGMGRDSSCICERMGDFVVSFEMRQSSGKAEHMELVGVVRNKLGGRSQAYIDTIGEGAGVYSRFTEMGYKNRVFSCKNTESAVGLHDVTGMYEFSNMRAYLYWAVRDWLNPANGFAPALPKDNSFAKECTEIRYMILSSGKIQIEDKAAIRKRLGASTDCFDALSLTFFPYASRKRVRGYDIVGYLP